MPSTPGIWGQFYGFRTPGTLQMIQSGASRAACQSLKRSSRFSGTWLDQLQRRTITVSSPPRCDHHLTGGDLLVVQDPPGWERLTRTFSPRTLRSTRHGGRQRTGMLGTKSSVRQRSARSSPPRRRRMHTVQYCCHKWSVGLSIGNTDVSWPYRFGYLESNYTRNSLGSSLWLWITITDTKHSVIQIVCLLGARGKCEWW